jgi:hypothetical protein
MPVFNLAPSITKIHIPDFVLYNLRYTNNITELLIKSSSSRLRSYKISNVHKGFPNLLLFDALDVHTIVRHDVFIPNPEKLMQLKIFVDTFDTLVHFAKAENLTVLVLQMNQNYEAEWLEMFFAGMKRLQEITLEVHPPLDIIINNVSLPSCFENMKHLRLLNLLKTHFTEIRTTLSRLDLLQTLYLPDCFDKPLANSLPKNLVALCIGIHFNQPIVQSEIEHLQNLEELYFRQFSRYNQPLNGGLLCLKKLRVLCFPNRFCQDINDELPANLKILDINGAAYNGKGLEFNKLPDSIREIYGVVRSIKVNPKYHRFLK